MTSVQGPEPSPGYESQFFHYNAKAIQNKTWYQVRDLLKASVDEFKSKQEKTEPVATEILEKHLAKHGITLKESHKKNLAKLQTLLQQHNRWIEAGHFFAFRRMEEAKQLLGLPTLAKTDAQTQPSSSQAVEENLSTSEAVPPTAIPLQAETEAPPLNPPEAEALPLEEELNPWGKDGAEESINSASEPGISPQKGPSAVSNPPLLLAAAPNLPVVSHKEPWRKTLSNFLTGTQDEGNFPEEASSILEEPVDPEAATLQAALAALQIDSHPENLQDSTPETVTSLVGPTEDEQRQSVFSKLATLIPGFVAAHQPSATEEPAEISATLPPEATPKSVPDSVLPPEEPSLEEALQQLRRAPLPDTLQDTVPPEAVHSTASSPETARPKVDINIRNFATEGVSNAVAHGLLLDTEGTPQTDLTKINRFCHALTDNTEALSSHYQAIHPRHRLVHLQPLANAQQHLNAWVARTENLTTPEWQEAHTSAQQACEAIDSILNTFPRNKNFLQGVAKAGIPSLVEVTPEVSPALELADDSLLEADLNLFNEVFGDPGSGTEVLLEEATGETDPPPGFPVTAEYQAFLGSPLPGGISSEAPTDFLTQPEIEEEFPEESEEEFKQLFPELFGQPPELKAETDLPSVPTTAEIDVRPTANSWRATLHKAVTNPGQFLGGILGRRTNLPAAEVQSAELTPLQDTETPVVEGIWTPRSQALAKTSGTLALPASAESQPEQELHVADLAGALPEEAAIQNDRQQHAFSSMRAIMKEGRLFDLRNRDPHSQDLNHSVDLETGAPQHVSEAPMDLTQLDEFPQTPQAIVSPYGLFLQEGSEELQLPRNYRGVAATELLGVMIPKINDEHLIKKALQSNPPDIHGILALAEMLVENKDSLQQVWQESLNAPGMPALLKEALTLRSNLTQLSLNSVEGTSVLSAEQQASIHTATQVLSALAGPAFSISMTPYTALQEAFYQASSASQANSAEHPSPLQQERMTPEAFVTAVKATLPPEAQQNLFVLTCQHLLYSLKSSEDNQYSTQELLNHLKAFIEKQPADLHIPLGGPTSLRVSAEPDWLRDSQLTTEQFENLFSQGEFAKDHLPLNYAPLTPGQFLNGILLHAEKSSQLFESKFSLSGPQVIHSLAPEEMSVLCDTFLENEDVLNTTFQEKLERSSQRHTCLYLILKFEAALSNWINHNQQSVSTELLEKASQTEKAVQTMTLNAFSTTDFLEIAHNKAATFNKYQHAEPASPVAKLHQKELPVSAFITAVKATLPEAYQVTLSGLTADGFTRYLVHRQGFHRNRAYTDKFSTVRLLEALNQWTQAQQQAEINTSE